MQSSLPAARHILHVGCGAASPDKLPAPFFPAQEWAEIRRVLKPDGFALMTMPDLQQVAADRLTEPAYMSPWGRSRRSTGCTATTPSSRGAMAS